MLRYARPHPRQSVGRKVPQEQLPNAIIDLGHSRADVDSTPASQPRAVSSTKYIQARAQVRKEKSAANAQGAGATHGHGHGVEANASSSNKQETAAAAAATAAADVATAATQDEPQVQCPVSSSQCPGAVPGVLGRVCQHRLSHEGQRQRACTCTTIHSTPSTSYRHPHRRRNSRKFNAH